MTDSSLDDQLKQAQVEKTLAEATKLKREGEATSKQAQSAFWSDLLKLLAGIILGIGGVVAAVTQYEVAELKAKAAKQELAQAEKAKAEADAMTKEALAKRDAARRELQEAEQAVKELKASLTQQTNELQSAKPELLKSRLAYIQYSGDISRNLINELRLFLQEEKFNAPGAERVAGEYQNTVKYFKPSDSADADRLAKAVEDFFAKQGCPLKLRLVPAATATGQASPLEVWLSLSCKK